MNDGANEAPNDPTDHSTDDGTDHSMNHHPDHPTPNPDDYGLDPLVPTGRAANGVFWRNLFAAVPDLEAELEDLALSGDEIAGRVTLRGTHTGGSMGIPPTGEAIVLRSVDIWNISDRILGNRWAELSELPLFRQLGAAARNMSDESAP